jgi:hypothetical protein
MPAEQKKPHKRCPYMSNPFRDSYIYKLGFYIFVLALPLIIMALVEAVAAGSAISVSSGDPTRFLAFLIYFLPGLVIAKNTTDSWWRTMGVGIAYVLISPAYYLGALQFACNFGGHCTAV